MSLLFCSPQFLSANKRSTLIGNNERFKENIAPVVPQISGNTERLFQLLALVDVVWRGRSSAR